MPSLSAGGGNEFLKNCCLGGTDYFCSQSPPGYILGEAFPWVNDQQFFLKIFFSVILWFSVNQIIKVP